MKTRIGARSGSWILVCILGLGLVNLSAREAFIDGESNGKVSVSFERQPLGWVLNELARPSGKRLILEAKLQETTTLSFSNIPWRDALEVVLDAHGLEKVETLNNLIIVAGKKRQFRPKVNPLKAKIPVEPIQARKVLGMAKCRVTGITGNHDQRVAIVEYQGQNRLWKVGTMVDPQLEVQSILENQVVLINKATGQKKTLGF